MSSSSEVPKNAEIEVENVGGIDRTTVSFDPGVTILSGRNATNRTSLLQAIMAAHGTDRASMKADAETGQVRLTIDGETYECHLTRENGQVVIGGNPYPVDTEVANLFAFLLENNATRRAVERGEDLQDLIMRPVDTDEIRSEIQELEEEKTQLDSRLEELAELERRLPDLEQQRTKLAEQIDAKKETLEAREAELERAEGSVDEKRETKRELDAKLAELREARSELESARYDLDTERETLESIQEKRASLEAEREELHETSAADLDQIETRLEDRHDRKQTIVADLNQLQTIIQFNEEMLEDADTSLLTVGDDEKSSSNEGSITDQLVDDTNTVTCWTCGSTTQEDNIADMVEDLREFRQRKLQEKWALEEEIEDLQSEKRDLESQQRRRKQLEQNLTEYDDRIDRTEETIVDMETRVSELKNRVTELETTVEELEQRDQSELLELHREVSQLEFDLERLKEDREEVETEIAHIEEQVDDRSSLNSRRRTVQEKLKELRNTVDRLERGAVDEFNHHMDALIEDLGFENLERVWLERKERETRRGRRNVSESVFELHVVRETDDGTVYEDTVDHLSESEREVVGFVLSLAGYLVHDVHESVPFMLLDSLEAIDAERIDALIEYFADYADYLVVALLSDDAATVDDEYARISEI